jgi:hypothetical protein
MTKAARLDFLTPEEMEHARTLWRELKDTGRFAAAVEREVIAPSIARINTALGQENKATYLAYAVEDMFTEADRAVPGYLWEWAEDVCKLCGKHLGRALRFMHSGLCDTCARAPKH